MIAIVMITLMMVEHDHDGVDEGDNDCHDDDVDEGCS